MPDRAQRNDLWPLDGVVLGGVLPHAVRAVVAGCQVLAVVPGHLLHLPEVRLARLSGRQVRLAIPAHRN